ncbi:MAG TPA: zf-HC2 domain-containing protein [Bryobacteraceae bacterium]
MTCEESKRLFVDYWSQSLTDAEEIELEAHLAGCRECRAEADRLEVLWRDLARIPTEEPGAGLRARFYEMLRGAGAGSAPAPSAGRRWWRAVPSSPALWRVAAGLALLGIGAAIGYAVRSNGTEIAQLRGEVSTMRQLVALSLLQQQSASERLRGVSWAYRVEPSDSEVLTALLDAVNRDPNVNVRLAAVDALHAFAANSLARQRVLESLENQTAPIVQVAIIDLLVDLKEGKAGPELRKLTENASIDNGVRQRAQWALERLE